MSVNTQLKYGGIEMLKRLTCGLFALLMLVSLLAGCGTNPAKSSSQSNAATNANNTSAPDAAGDGGNGANAKPVTLSFLFGDPVMSDWFTEHFPEYISGNNPDGITVVPEYQQEATKVLQVKAAAGEVPDLISSGLPQEMMDQGRFLDLSGEPWWDSLNPAAKDLSTDVKSGKNYFIPMCMGAVGIFYNKDIFTELNLKEAKTWDELVENLRVIKKQKPDVTPFYICGKEAYTFGHMIDFMVDGVAKQKLGFAGFEQAASKNDLEALGWNAQSDAIIATYARDMLQLQSEGLLNENVVTASLDNQIEAFVTGKVGMMSQGAWVLSDMQTKAPDFTAIGFAPYPAMLPNSKSVVGNTLDSYITISAASANVEAAKKIAEAMLQPDAIKSLSETRGAIPSNPTVDANWSIIKDEVANVINGDAVGVSFTQNLPGSFNGDERGRLVQELMVGKYNSPETFAEEYLTYWNEAYASIN